MIYPNDFEQKIAFDKIRSLLKGFCVSELGKKQVDKMQFSHSYPLLEKLHRQTDEFYRILLSGRMFPCQNYFDLSQELTRLKAEGTFIEIENLCNLRASLQTINDCLDFFRPDDNESITYPQLAALTENVTDFSEMVTCINEIANDKGEIKDNASTELAKIRQQIRSIQNEISREARQALLFCKQLKLIDDTAELTIRDGCYVLPVPAVNKRKVKGFVHDVSSSGQTYFIQPQQVYEATTLLHNLYAEQRREIVAILKAFADHLRPRIDHLLQGYRFLSIIDFIRSKAKFALEMNACTPVITPKAVIDWKKVVHPLLWLSLKAKNKSIVPLDIHLGTMFRILIISGPNAGGKSVCLKTLALTQYMFQCGMPVCCHPVSEFGIFKKIFIDIGDEQSIENDLSTYSSHLKNMQTLLRYATAESLFLIDELGGGTDPQYGEAIAEALLEALAQKDACGLVTTHFGRLKVLANKNPKIENGAMLFNKEEMQPLFTLKIGEFGTSFTFEIAERIGLDKRILQRASSLAGKEKIRYEQLVYQLQDKEKALEEQQKMLDLADSHLFDLTQQYKQNLVELKSKQSDLLKKARLDAQALLRDANKLIEKAVREIRQHKADKEITKKVKAEIQTFVQQIDEQIAAEQPVLSTQAEEKMSEEIALHDTVIMLDTHTIGEVTSLDEDEVVISFNSVNIRTGREKVRKISKTEGKKLVKSSVVFPDFAKKVADFNLQLDLRGMRVEEAALTLEKYIDDALLLSIHHVRILHGKGNGILRLTVREQLARNPQIKSFKDAHIDSGGSGITEVEM